MIPSFVFDFLVTGDGCKTFDFVLAQLREVNPELAEKFDATLKQRHGSGTSSLNSSAYPGLGEAFPITDRNKRDVVRYYLIELWMPFAFPWEDHIALLSKHVHHFGALFLLSRSRLSPSSQSSSAARGPRRCSLFG